MKRIWGTGLGRGVLSRIWWMVGTAVYQFALWVVKSVQKSVAENLGGTMTEPPEYRGARNAARRPWTWNNGITRYVRSAGVRLYVAWMFPGVG